MWTGPGIFQPRQSIKLRLEDPGAFWGLSESVNVHRVQTRWLPLATDDVDCYSELLHFDVIYESQSSYLRTGICASIHNGGNPTMGTWRSSRLRPADDTRESNLTVCDDPVRLSTSVRRCCQDNAALVLTPYFNYAYEGLTKMAGKIFRSY
ncbi:hypothetical protein Bbelb_427070 [Branchiostoma belcheri]|nr:hypothetical protein Bbelb_427070 [Branchiostoma belcheri]